MSSGVVNLTFEGNEGRGEAVVSPWSKWCEGEIALSFVLIDF